MKKYVVIAGAGISMASPSNLPSWWDFNKSIVLAIKEKALELCPEAKDTLSLFDEIEKSNIPVQCISDIIVNQAAGESYFPLLTLLNSSKPNKNHFALAELANKGVLKAIITTNFDTLIESAFSKEKVPLFIANEEKDYLMIPNHDICKLLKIHGSVINYKTLIDTVTQKSVGLSPNKLLALNGVLSDSEIIIVGFSGADLDFDINYIPFSDAIETGSTIKWIIRKGSTPNHNVYKLKEMYPSSVEIVVDDIPEYFIQLGLPPDSLNDSRCITESFDHEQTGIFDKIKKVLSLHHIGTHGCVGYCISLLNASGKKAEASILARIYEKHLIIDKENLLFSTPGIMQLSLQKMREKDYQKAQFWLKKCIFVTNYILYLTTNISNSKSIFLTSNLSSNKYIKEYCFNQSSLYNNLGLIYLYEEKNKRAILFFKKAMFYAEKCSNKKQIGIILFNIARAEYRLDHDYDKLLIRLKKAMNYSRLAGNINTFLEILIYDCKIRFNLGEYYIISENIKLIESNLNNVTKSSFCIEFYLILAELSVRTGAFDNSYVYIEKAICYTEKETSKDNYYVLLSYLKTLYFYNEKSCMLISRLCKTIGKDVNLELKEFEKINSYYQSMPFKIPIIIFSNFPENKERIGVILSEFKIKRDNVSKYFDQISKRYILNNKWERLIEISRCFLASANNDCDKSVALYRIGCGLSEIGEYSSAIDVFTEVIKKGESAKQTILGWSYIEIAKILARNPLLISYTSDYYQKGMNHLSVVSLQEMEAACISYLDAILKLNLYNEAKERIDFLLTMDISDNCKNTISHMRKYVMPNILNIQNYEDSILFESPEAIATEALKKYELDKEQAWYLVRLAKEKYALEGNNIGIAKCENNMGCFCVSERKYEQAINHFKESFDIKISEKELNGAVSDLSTIICCYCELQDNNEFDDYIVYAELHIPNFYNCSSKFNLYFSLFLYYLKKEEYGLAYKYAELANEGIDYSSTENTKAKDTLEKMINAILEAYKETSIISLDEYNQRIHNLIRAYQKGDIKEFDSSVDHLRKEVSLDRIQLGQLEGTIGNANLEKGNYIEAINCFDNALSCFYEIEGVEKLKKEFICTAINGKVLALSKLNRNEECTEYLADYLLKNDINSPSEVPLVCNYCNRIFTGDEKIKKDSDLYRELKSLLDKIKEIQGLSYEESGAFHHTYGLLCFLVDDYDNSIEYFKKAKHEFEIINSDKAQSSEQMLRLAEAESKTKEN